MVLSAPDGRRRPSPPGPVWTAAGSRVAFGAGRVVSKTRHRRFGAARSSARGGPRLPPPVRSRSRAARAFEGGRHVHDLVIANARIVDGLGTPAREGSLAVKDGRIAAVGDDLGAAAHRVDGAGLVPAPGIIDLHTHYDAQLTWDAFATPSTALGVTTRGPATDGGMAQMRGLVLEALRSGAIGFATSTLEQHNGENGVPMPSRLADDREMLALTGALGEASHGVFMLTKGMTTTIPW